MTALCYDAGMTDPLDIAWAAGFWEGEGWVTVWKHRPKPGAKQYRYLCMGASQVERECLDRLKALFGGTVGRKGKSQDIWVWKVTGAGAQAMADILLPHLSTRRRAQIAQKRSEV